MIRRAAFVLAMTTGLAAGCSGTSNAPQSSTTAAGASPRAAISHHATVTTTYATIQNGLRERIVTYDPPKHVATGEWLTRDVFFSGFPGAPSLVLQMPCTREEATVPPDESRTDSCRLPKITKGDWAGRYVSIDGEIITPPPH